MKEESENSQSTFRTRIAIAVAFLALQLLLGYLQSPSRDVAQVTPPIAPATAPAIAPMPESARTPALVCAPPVVPLLEEKKPLSVSQHSLNILREMKVHEVYQRKGSTLLVPRTGSKFLKTPVTLAWNGAVSNEKIFVQVSRDHTFEKPWLEHESTGSNVVIDQWKVGKNFWRVSRDRKNWSFSGEVNIKPVFSVSQTPSVTALKNKVVISVGENGPEAEAKLLFEDTSLKNVHGWVLQGSRSAKFPVESSKAVYVSQSRIDVPLRKPGRYYFRVRSVASAGEISSFSLPIEVQAVKAHAAPVQIRLAKNRGRKQREIAAVQPALPEASSSSRIEIQSEPARNVFRPWKLSIEAGEFALFSTEQLGSSVGAANVQVLALRADYSDENNSVGIGYRGQVGGGNVEGLSQSTSRLDLDYKRWWQTSWRPLRLGWVGGFSSYRNQASRHYTKGYDVLLTGPEVELSLAEKWKTGGFVTAGASADYNRIYELGGFLSYEFTRELAFGIGYRVGLFEAGAVSSSPAGLPYREAMGEAYSSLQISF